MGYSRKREGRDGKNRYTAYYRDLKGRERSAGTYGTKRKPTEAGSARKRSLPREDSATRHVAG